MSPRAIRVGVVVSLALPALIVLMTSSLQAQFPKQPRPPIGPPKFERVWICSKCGKEIGRGAFPPGTCPFCGAKIINGIGGGSPNPNNPMPQPMPQPTPPVMQPNQNGQRDLAGSSWQGSETLMGYGALTFTFSPGGQATMIDRDGNTRGNWSRNGNQITVSFPGGISYKGTINGGQISGTANNGKNSWNWQVSNNQFSNQPAPINPMPMPGNPTPINPTPPPYTPPGNPQPGNPQPYNPPGNPQAGNPQPNNPQPGNPQPYNPQPGNPQPVASPAPQAAPQPAPTAQPNSQKAPAANPEAAETPRASRSGLIAVIVGIVFLGVGLAVVGGGIFFIFKSMK
ncbi:MAG TPA: hypothetical protein VFE62_16970 [Gemmataceae bacterium]|nr:hypothetical protein [Gemmataceae bacterium]